MVVATQAPSRFEVRRRRSRELSASAASASASAASTAAGAVRATRIVATLGPASADRGVLDAMVAAGMDVARVNCSHGSPATWQQASRLARQAGTRIGRPVGVLFDISGPKMRVAGLSDPGLVGRRCG